MTMEGGGMTAHQSEEIGPLPCTPAAARDAIDSARRKVMDLYGGNLDHPALDHLEAALCAVEDIERDRSLAPHRGALMPEHSEEIAQMRLDYSTDQRVWDLLNEVERLREALRAAGLAPSVVAAIAKGEPPRPCPAGHGDQCCGYPAACEASLTGSPTQEETR